MEVRFDEYELDGFELFGSYDGEIFYVDRVQVKGKNFSLGGKLGKNYTRGFTNIPLDSELKLKDDLFICRPRELNRMLEKSLTNTPVYDYTPEQLEKLMQSLLAYERDDATDIILDDVQGCDENWK